MTDQPTPFALPTFAPGDEALADDLNTVVAAVEANTSAIAAIPTSQRSAEIGLPNTPTLTTGVWTKLAQRVASTTPGFVENDPNGQDVRILVPGIYAVTMIVTGSLGEAGWRVIAAPTVNGAAYPEATAWWSDQTIHGDYAMLGARPLAFNAGDRYELWVYNRGAQLLYGARTWLTSIGAA